MSSAQTSEHVHKWERATRISGVRAWYCEGCDIWKLRDPRTREQQIRALRREKARAHAPR